MYSNAREQKKSILVLSTDRRADVVSAARAIELYGPRGTSNARAVRIPISRQSQTNGNESKRFSR